MPTRLMLSPPLTVAALETRDRSRRAPVARSHWQMLWLLLPTVSITAFTVALAECAPAVGAGHAKQILVGLEGAGWHARPHVQVPAGVPVHCLPPSAPE